MGAWGSGLQANDTALDALGLFANEIEKVAAGKMKPLALLQQVPAKFEGEEAQATLGVADALLDHEVDLSSARDFLSNQLAPELAPAALEAWSDPHSRVDALERFERRLAGEGVASEDLERDNAGLMDRIVELKSGVKPVPPKGDWCPRAEAILKRLRSRPR